MPHRLTAARVLSAFLPAAGGFLRALGRAARQLGHEIVGALFAFFAVGGAVSTWKAWRQASPAWVLGVSAAFALMMGCFCVMSFWKAYKLGRAK